MLGTYVDLYVGDGRDDAEHPPYSAGFDRRHSRRKLSCGTGGGESSHGAFCDSVRGESVLAPIEERFSHVRPAVTSAGCHQRPLSARQTICPSSMVIFCWERRRLRRRGRVSRLMRTGGWWRPVTRRAGRRRSRSSSRIFRRSTCSS